MDSVATDQPTKQPPQHHTQPEHVEKAIQIFSFLIRQKYRDCATLRKKWETLPEAQHNTAGQHCGPTESVVKLKKLRFFVACAHPTNPRGQQQRFNSANVPHGNR